MHSTYRNNVFRINEWCRNVSKKTKLIMNKHKRYKLLLQAMPLISDIPYPKVEDLKYMNMFCGIKVEEKPCPILKKKKKK